MKTQLRTLAAVAMAACSLLSAKDFRLKGGKLSTIDDTTVETFGDDLNFMFAYRFSDGTIHLNHSQGIHTVTEYGCNDISPDNGRTWIHRENKENCGINTFEGLDGGKYSVGTWDLECSDVHKLTLHRFDDATQKKVVESTFEIKMPFSCQFLSHRDIIRLPSGKLLATYYGHIKDAPKCHVGLIESSDDGRTWAFTGIIADDPEAKTVEGPDEATIFQLKDGRICALYRDDGNGILKQCFSSDEGKTWTAPQPITLFKGAASPHGRVLKDGTIVAVSGRPNLYLLVDFSGTGEQYQKVEIYHGAGSSYASVLETGDNEILIIYDESDFGGRDCATGFARIHASRYRLTRNTAEEEQKLADERSKDFDHFYSPLNGRMPLDDEFFMPSGYKKAGENDLCYYEIRNIPERPYPVLHVVSHGDNTKQAGSDYANLNHSESIGYCSKVKLEMEMRMNDAVEPRPNGQIHIFVPAGLSDLTPNGYHGYVAMGAKEVIFTEEGTQKRVPCDLRFGVFHKYTYIIDAKANRQELFIDDAKEPVFSAKLTLNPSGTSVIFGDGSANIYGDVDLSYIGWKVLE